MSYPGVWRLGLTLTLLTCAGAVRADEHDGPVSDPVPLPGGVADEGGKTGFVTGEQGRVEAIDLATGRVLWQTEEQARPLIAQKGGVAAWAPVKGKANALRVLVFDTARQGKRFLQSDPVVFPDWVSVELAQGRRFAAGAQVAGPELLLHWQAHAFYAGGAPPPPEVLAAAKKDASGTFRIHLVSGKVREGPAEKRPGGQRFAFPEALKGTRSSQYWTGASWETDLVPAGDMLAALDRQVMAGGKQKLVLKRWDHKTGKALEPVVLLEGKELWPQVGPGGYLFVHQALVKEQLPEGDYAWWVFSLQTGKQLGKVPFEPGAEAMTVLGNRAFFLVPGAVKGRPAGGVALGQTQPRALKAYDLTTGRLLWQRAVEPIRRLPLPV